MKYPKFSVIIPAHNEEDLIKKAIKSVQNQTFQNFEIIVSNDGSTDKTREIVEKMIKKDKRIKLLNQSKGHSGSFARNRGAEIAKGEIFIFLDADTYFNNLFLEKINKHKGKADAFVVDCFPVKNNLINSALAGLYVPIVIKKGENTNNLMFFCITKKAFNEIKGYDEEIFYYEDKSIAERFYKKRFKSIFVGGAKQYFELPSTFNEFFRQCKWIGRGTNTIKEKKKRIRRKLYWFGKFLFLISPLFFIFNIYLFLSVLLFTILFTYIQLIKRNKDLKLSLITLPFVYIKTFLVSFNIVYSYILKKFIKS